MVRRAQNSGATGVGDAFSVTVMTPIGTVIAALCTQWFKLSARYNLLANEVT
jgi:hypothetical protein